MRRMLVHALGLAALGLSAAACSGQAAEQASRGEDKLNAALTTRTAAVTARLEAARMAGRVTPAEAARMADRLAWVRTDSARYVQEQGFLSAGESASYNRALDEIERELG